MCRRDLPPVLGRESVEREDVGARVVEYPGDFRVGAFEHPGDLVELGPDVLQPGEHGSTFGGNPLAAAVGLAVVKLLATGEYQERARSLGARLHAGPTELIGHGVIAVRGAGLWAGIDIDPELATGREVSEALMARGVLAKDTHGSTIRLAPPIVVSADDIDWAVEQLAAVLEELSAAR